MRSIAALRAWLPIPIRNLRGRQAPALGRANDRAEPRRPTIAPAAVGCKRTLTDQLPYRLVRFENNHWATAASRYAVSHA